MRRSTREAGVGHQRSDVSSVVHKNSGGYSFLSTPPRGKRERGTSVLGEAREKNQRGSTWFFLVCSVVLKNSGGYSFLSTPFRDGASLPSEGNERQEGPQIG
jgi:hypothetical protein